VQALLAVAVPGITVLLLAAVGLDVAPAHLGRVRRQGPALAAGLLVPPILLPLLALALVAWFRPGPDVATGLLLVAACPIGGISNSYSYLARASVPLSLVLTTSSCLAAPLTLPLATVGLEALLGRALGFRVPIPALALYLVGMLALPVGMGMWVGRRWPAWADRHRPTLQRVGFVALGVLVALVLASDVRALAMGLEEGVPLAAVFVLGSLAVGSATGRALRVPRADRFTLTAEFGTRNLAVATSVAVSVLGRLEFARFAALYLLVEIPILLVAVALFRRGWG
jgi:BASS family bile acid:Na+ symporter